MKIKLRKKEKSYGDIELHIFNNKILFKTGNLKFESRLINGTYANTSNLLPDDSYLVVSTNLNAFYHRYVIMADDTEDDGDSAHDIYIYNEAFIRTGYLSGGDQIDIDEPVSYTHLDVYKRQGLWRLVVARLIKWLC